MNGANSKLIKAVKNGNIIKVIEAINSGADINCKFNDLNPLLLAINGHKNVKEIVKILVDSGAKKEEISERWVSAFFAIDKDKAEVLSYLIDFDFLDKLIGPQTLLQRAAGISCKCLTFLLKSGANPKILDSGGRSALMYAARAGNLECISLLLPISDLNIKDFNNYNAIDHAKSFGHHKAVYLMENYINTINEANEIQEVTNTIYTKKRKKSLKL